MLFRSKGVAPALNAVLAGEVQLMFIPPTSAVQHIQSGRVRALAYTGKARWSVLPDVPTVAESALPGYEIVGWEGFFAPIGTPREIVNRVNAMVNEILQTPEMRELWASKGVDFVPNTVEQFAARVRDDYENTGKLIKAAGIKAEQ